jgi:hypothetical protein
MSDMEEELSIDITERNLDVIEVCICLWRCIGAKGQYARNVIGQPGVTQESLVLSQSF